MTQTIVSNLIKRIDTTGQKFGVGKIILNKFILLIFSICDNEDIYKVTKEFYYLNK